MVVEGRIGAQEAKQLLAPFGQQREGLEHFPVGLLVQGALLQPGKLSPLLGLDEIRDSSVGQLTGLTASARNDILGQIGGDAPAEEDQSYTDGPVVLTRVADPVEAARQLRNEGLVAQVDHVFFAVPVHGAGVGGAPVMFGGVSGAPVMFGGVSGAPVLLGGVSGAPVMFGGVGGAPVMFGGVFGMVGGDACGCCHLDFGPPSGSPAAPRQSTVRPTTAPSAPSGKGRSALRRACGLQCADRSGEDGSRPLAVHPARSR